MPDFVLSAFLALAALAAVVDLRTRTIPDTLNLAVLGLAIGARLAGWTALPWASMGLGVAVGFAVPACLFFVGAMGGGDVKLLAALGAGVGLDGLLPLLFWTAVTGGVLALPLVIKRRRAARAGATSVEGVVSGEHVVRDGESPGVPPSSERELAYAPAIAVGLALAWFTGDLAAVTGGAT